jgi:Holliday junction resolvase RusA-like endonuclease
MGGEAREYRFVIPVLPPSVNSLHQIIYSQRRVELKPEVRKWRSDAVVFIPRLELEPNSMLDIAATFHYPHYHANGKLRRFDTHNLVKVLLDLIAWKGNFDDCRVKSGTWASVDSRDEQVEVRLREVL